MLHLFTYHGLILPHLAELLFLYARLKNVTYYVAGYGVRPSVIFFMSG